MEKKQQWLFKSCRPTEFVSNVIIGGGGELSIWDRYGVKFHEMKMINLANKTYFSLWPRHKNESM
jgi:hypothetical protein